MTTIQKDSQSVQEVNEMKTFDLLHFLGVNEPDILKEIKVNNMCFCNFKDVKEKNVWHFLTIGEESLRKDKIQIISIYVGPNKKKNDEKISLVEALYEGLLNVVTQLDDIEKWKWCNTTVAYDLEDGSIVLKILTEESFESTLSEEDLAKDPFYHIIVKANQVFTPEVIDEVTAKNKNEQ